MSGRDGTTLHDYYRTGIGDARNACSTGDLDLKGAIQRGETAEQIVDAWLSSDDWQDKASWLDQQEPGDRASLGDIPMWEAWRSGWREVAIREVRHDMSERCDVCGGLDEGNTCCDSEDKSHDVCVSCGTIYALAIGHTCG